MEEGCVYPFDENLGDVNVYFKTRGGVGTILIELRGGECNFLLKSVDKENFDYSRIAVPKTKY